MALIFVGVACPKKCVPKKISGLTVRTTGFKAKIKSQPSKNIRVKGVLLVSITYVCTCTAQSLAGLVQKHYFSMGTNQTRVGHMQCTAIKKIQHMC